LRSTRVKGGICDFLRVPAAKAGVKLNRSGSPKSIDVFPGLLGQPKEDSSPLSPGTPVHLVLGLQSTQSWDSSPLQSSVHSSPVLSPLQSTPQSTPVHSSVHSSPLLSPLQSTPVLSPLHSSVHSTPQSTPVHSSPLQSTPVHSSPLQSTPVHSSPLQSTPVHSSVHSSPQSCPQSSTLRVLSESSPTRGLYYQLLPAPSVEK